jgi:hypothetical protein
MATTQSQYALNLAGIGRAFLAGALSVLVFQMGVAAILHAAGILSNAPYSLAPTAPFGVPQTVSSAFWGGLWGIVMQCTFKDNKNETLSALLLDSGRAALRLGNTIGDRPATMARVSNATEFSSSSCDAAHSGRIDLSITSPTSETSAHGVLTQISRGDRP